MPALHFSRNAPGKHSMSMESCRKNVIHVLTPGIGIIIYKVYKEEFGVGWLMGLNTNHQCGHRPVLWRCPGVSGTRCISPTVLHFLSHLNEDKALVQQVSSPKLTQAAWFLLWPIWKKLFLVSLRTFQGIRCLRGTLCSLLSLRPRAQGSVLLQYLELWGGEAWAHMIPSGQTCSTDG